MDRVQIYAAEGITSYDLNYMGKNPLKAIGWLAQFILNQTATYVTGFVASQTSTPSLSINLSAGQVYEYTAVDASPVGGGSVPADSLQVLQQGFAAAQTLNLNTSGMVSGQSQWWLVEASFVQVDGVNPDDGTDGDRPFYNSSNPSIPLEGQNGLGGIIATTRFGVAKIQLIAGTPATTGSEIPPAPSAGYVPLYLIDLSHGQSAITNGDIQLAGPAAYSGYQNAPFLAGLLQHHHGGVVGQAPQIDLTSEVMNILGLAHLPASNTVGVLSCLRFGSGNPNGVLAGDIHDTYLDTTNVIMYFCTSSGPATGGGAAVWVALGLTYSDIHVNTSPYDALSQFATYFVDSSAGAMTLNLPTGAVPGKVTVRNIGNPMHPITVQAGIQAGTTGQLVNGAGSVEIEGEDAMTFETDTSTSNWWDT